MNNDDFAESFTRSRARRLATMAHFDGSSWSPASAPMPSGYRPYLTGTGPSDVWLENGRVHHFDGSTWTTLPPGSGLVHGTMTTAAPGELYQVNTYSGPLLTGPSHSATALPAAKPSNVRSWDGTAWLDMGILAAHIYSPAPGEVWAFYGNQIYRYRK
jgi:hypothetical protein